MALLCVPVQANTPLDLGLRLLEQGEGLRALAALKPLAHDGNPEAQFRLGTIYERGLGVLADDYWAWYWYQAAAAQGHTPALEALQGLAERHPGVVPEALAQQPTPPAGAAAPAESSPADDTASAVGDPPLTMGGTAQDTAVDSPGDAADDATAAATVPEAGIVSPVDGAMDGTVVAPGRGELAALQRARAAGIEVRFEASQPLPAARGDSVTGQPTSDGPPAPAAGNRESAPALAPAVLAEAPAEVTSPGSDGAPGMTLALLDDSERLRGLPEAELTALASSGDVVAQRELALRLHAGRGRPKDLPGALAWYRRAAEAGDAEAQYQLGNLYLMGDGIEADDAWAITWFRRAAAQGHARAEANLRNLVQLSGAGP